MNRANKRSAAAALGVFVAEGGQESGKKIIRTNARAGSVGQESDPDLCEEQGTNPDIVFVGFGETAATAATESGPFTTATSANRAAASVDLREGNDVLTLEHSSVGTPRTPERGSANIDVLLEFEASAGVSPLAMNVNQSSGDARPEKALDVVIFSSQPSTLSPPVPMMVTYSGEASFAFHHWLRKLSHEDAPAAARSLQNFFTPVVIDLTPPGECTEDNNSPDSKDSAEKNEQQRFRTAVRGVAYPKEDASWVPNIDILWTQFPDTQAWLKAPSPGGKFWCHHFRGTQEHQFGVDQRKNMAVFGDYIQLIRKNWTNQVLHLDGVASYNIRFIVRDVILESPQDMKSLYNSGIYVGKLKTPSLLSSTFSSASSPGLRTVPSFRSPSSYSATTTSSSNSSSNFSSPIRR